MLYDLLIGLAANAAIETLKAALKAASSRFDVKELKDTVKFSLQQLLK